MAETGGGTNYWDIIGALMAAYQQRQEGKDPKTKPVTTPYEDKIFQWLEDLKNYSPTRSYISEYSDQFLRGANAPGGMLDYRPEFKSDYMRGQELPQTPRVNYNEYMPKYWRADYKGPGLGGRPTGNKGPLGGQFGGPFAGGGMAPRAKHAGGFIQDAGQAYDPTQTYDIFDIKSGTTPFDSNTGAESMANIMNAYKYYTFNTDNAGNAYVVNNQTGTSTPVAKEILPDPATFNPGIWSPDVSGYAKFMQESLRAMKQDPGRWAAVEGWIKAYGKDAALAISSIMNGNPVGLGAAIIHAGWTLWQRSKGGK